MEDQIAQVNPAEQAPQPKEGNTNQIDYKSFFEQAIDKEVARQSQIEEALQGKLSDHEKLALEREKFEIEKRMYELGIRQPSTGDVVESIVELGLKPWDGQYDFIKNAIEGLSIQEARPVVEAFKEFIKAWQQPSRPADLTNSPIWSWARWEPVGYSSKDLIGQNSRAAKQNLVDLMSALAGKE